MKSMSQLAILTRRWSPATMKLGPFQEVILESSSVDELKEKVLRWHCYDMYGLQLWLSAFFQENKNILYFHGTEACNV